MRTTPRRGPEGRIRNGAGDRMISRYRVSPPCQAGAPRRFPDGFRFRMRGEKSGGRSGSGDTVHRLHERGLLEGLGEESRAHRLEVIDGARSEEHGADEEDSVLQARLDSTDLLGENEAVHVGGEEIEAGGPLGG